MEYNILAIDPGLTIGLAHVNVVNSSNSNPAWDAWQTESIHEAESWLEDHEDWNSNILLVEDYVGSGALTKEAKQTIMRLGYFILSYEGAYAFSVEHPVPQKRKSCVTLAMELATSRNIEGPHSWDALAHILAWMKRNDVSGSIFG